MYLQAVVVKGTMRFSSGQVQEGQFEGGLLNGMGKHKQLYPTPHFYEGPFKNGIIILTAFLLEIF